MNLTLPDLSDVQLTPIEGGFHVKDLPDGRCVDVMRMIFNWRVVRTAARDADGAHLWFDRGWCYQGTGEQTLLVAVTAVLAWDGADDTEPGGGWIKRAL
jgi:hypothetical protein